MQLNKIHAIKTVDRVAAELGETVDRLDDLATNMETEDGVICGLRHRRCRGLGIHPIQRQKPHRDHRHGKRPSNLNRMRPSPYGYEQGANLLLQVRVAIANDDLEERLTYKPPARPRYPTISPFVPVPLFKKAA